MEQNKSKQIDWIIHFVTNIAACDVYGKTEDSFPDFMCNAHTHGMEQYNHLNFQIVISLELQLIGRLLNDMGTRVQNGEKFKSGDVISDLLQGYDVKLAEVEETGRNVLRILLPDENHRFPGDEGCAPIFAQQLDFKTI